MIFRSPLIAFAAATLALAGCSGSGNEPLAPRIPEQAPGPPAQVTLGGVAMSLSTSINRDFMPISPPDGGPLTLAIQVRSLKGAALPAGLSIASATVRYQGREWTSMPNPLPESDPAWLGAVSAGGPKWGPGVMVDVVVVLELAGRRVSVDITNQWISGTD